MVALDAFLRFADEYDIPNANYDQGDAGPRPKNYSGDNCRLAAHALDYAPKHIEATTNVEELPSDAK